MHNQLLRAWQQKNWIFYLILVPLSWLFATLTTLRRALYTVGLLRAYALPVPVIVVGNINVGGSGKTPVVIWLVNQLKAKGYRPGVISRGYGAEIARPTPVQSDSRPSDVGDEPVLIKKKTGCPVWVSADRVATGNCLLRMHPECDIIVNDDGLQHYRLQRQIEIAVIDKQSRPEQRLLPAGPLREPFLRLTRVDAVIANGHTSVAGAYNMQLSGSEFYNLLNPDLIASPSGFQHKNIVAIAGIGQPDRFFAHLRNLGLQFTEQRFADHYAYTAQDLADIKCETLLMTEKDAVKCQSFAQAHHWVLPVEATIDSALLPMLLSKLQKKTEG